jgi:hypothetical protein
MSQTTGLVIQKCWSRTPAAQPGISIYLRPGSRDRGGSRRSGPTKGARFLSTAVADPVRRDGGSQNTLMTVAERWRSARAHSQRVAPGRGQGALARSASKLRVERVADRVAQEVEAEHHYE